MSTIRELIKSLQEYENQDQVICNTIWTIEDVHQVCEDWLDDVEVSDQEAGDVLNYVEGNWDANFGINWEFIADVTMNIVGERND